MERLVAALAVTVTLASCSGCGLGPRNFRKITHPAPLVRARAISLGYGQSDAVVIPCWSTRLNDPDVVVRMAANEELKKRTGRDLGFVPWAKPRGASQFDRALASLAQRDAAGTAPGTDARPAEKELARNVAPEPLS